MTQPQLQRTKRPRIQIGILVASTNPIQQACIKSLTIAHYYRPLSCKRVKRVVLISNN